MRAELDRARRSLASGDLTAAVRDARAFLGRAPDDAARAEAQVILAACAQHAKDVATALQHAREALRLNHLDVGAHYLHAELQEANGDARGAIASLRHAVALEPKFARGWFYLGILEGEAGDAAAAAKAFEATVRLDPRHARGWNNLGNALRRLGRLVDAGQAFAQAVAHKPDYWLAVANHAQALRDVGEVEQAEVVLREALGRYRDPKPFRPMIVLLAGLTRERGLLDESAQLYWKAIQLAPKESAAEWFHLGWVLGERGDVERAREAYARAYALDRRELHAWFGQHLALPMIYRDEAMLEQARDGFARGLDVLERGIEQAVSGLTDRQVLDGSRWANFFLAYQGRDDLDLQRRYARVVARAVEARGPQWRVPLPPEPVLGRRIRVGFASAFLHVGTVGRYFRSWITDLPRDRFEVFVYHLWPGMDEVAEAIHARADTFRTFGGSESRPSIVAPAIRGDTLDLLVYPELGMDLTSFVLASLRLAPRQWSAWGHPVTTGHDTIDAFVTCEAMEPPDASTHYTERLLLLPGIGTRYVRPEVPLDGERRDFALPGDAVLLLCPQSLWKIHPATDSLFAEVLEAHPQARLVLFSGRHPAITDQFMRRLEKELAARGLAIRERVIVLPQLPHPDFMRVNRLCDAMLDTLHWSGGNTSLDALACGLPIVTLPGAHMRGRQSAAMLGLVGAGELVAEDRASYLAITSRIVRDAGWRDALRERIRTAQDRLFGCSDALTRWVELIEQEVRESR